ncbi:MAG: EAL domain-containing protein [Methylococcaceae bacterium]
MKSLASKFNFLTIFLILLTALVTGGYLIWLHQNNALKNFTQHGIETAVMLSKNVEYGVYTENLLFIQQSLQRLADNTDIAYLVICTKNHKILVEKNFIGLSKLPEMAANNPGYKHLKQSTFTDPEDNKSYINIIAPVYMQSVISGADSIEYLTRLNNQTLKPELIGYVQLGINQNRIYEDSRQFMLQTLPVAALTVAIGILLTLWQTRRITLPIKKLVLATKAIAKGDFDKELVLSSEDEIGELASSFNAMSKDLTRYQTAMSSYLQNLEELVNQRTNDLQLKTEEACQLANKSEAANQAKSEFIATMSHEIRTPMYGVLGMTELLLNTTLNSRQQRLAHSAFRSAESLLGIINNILDYSKFEVGKFQLAMKDFNLRQLLEETAEILSTQAHLKGLELILSLPYDLNAIVKGDDERLRQILINLLGNAIKFTEHGEIQLQVSYLESDKSDGTLHLRFAVTDTGTGIPLDQQQSIFESFTQADGSITRRYGGTGLGLTISKKLVELMGSELKLESTAGKGSCFYFNLCLACSSLSTIAKADYSALIGLAVLVVEDNATNRAILHDQLSHWGVRCYCVATGTQALEHLKEAASLNDPYQIALLDWHMPEMNGLSLAKAIDAEPLIPRLSLVMLSSDSFSFDEENYYGISYFLDKPVIQEKMLDCLLEVLGTQNKTIKLNSKEHYKLTGKILIAEDNLVNQQVGSGILSAIGCQAQIVNNGKEAVQAFTEQRYDLILMDCHMPEMDGFEATTKIRQHEQTLPNQAYTPIIGLTADVQKGIVKKCLDAGMDGYLSKPFNKKQLIDVMEKWLSDKITPETSCSEQKKTAVKALNPVALDNLRSLTSTTNDSLLKKVIEIFLITAPQEISKLRVAIENSDAGNLAKIAHGFKSSCANLGAQTLADSAAALEKIGNQGHTKGAIEILATMEQELPLVFAELRDEITTSDSAVQNTPVQNQPHHELPAIRILLVDDDPTFRLITSEALRAAKFLVSEASSGLQALEQIKHQLPDIVLLDAVMEGLDGFETCRLLKANPVMADIPIIMLTALGDNESINLAFSAGATDFVVKQIPYPLLINRLYFIYRASQNAAELRNSRLQLTTFAALTAAQRIARLGYWTWYTKSGYFQISAYLAHLCGINMDEFDCTLDSFIQLIHPQDRNYVNNIMTAATHSNVVKSAEYRLQGNKSDFIIVHQEIEIIIDKNEAIVTGTVQDITHRKETEKQIHHLAYFDNLTGLASRSYYHERIEGFIKAASRRNEQFAFLFLDLDGFKEINDRYGHNIGDEFLKAIAQNLKLVTREIDFIARLGGDEFCIILANITDDEGVAEMANRCLQKLNQPLLLGSHEIIPSVSIGIAIFPRDGQNESELIKAADTAMYSAKQLGKRRYVFYSPNMSQQATQRREKEHMLREAFREKQFVLHYQPQVSMITGQIVGVEALIRWHHPEQGLIFPDEFISLAERLGLIVELGNWVLETACWQLAQWHQSGLNYIQMAVNLSSIHFQDHGLVETVRDLLKKTGVPAQYLELEVTESSMQTKGHIEVFKQLRALGVKIAIDDFGTGFSCLASLQQLPLDCLKIDKIFVDDMLYNPHTSLLLGTIIGLANALGYTMVAEGVETKDQAVIIQDLGCNIMQGFLYSRAIPGDEIPDMIKNYVSNETNN